MAYLVPFIHWVKEFSAGKEDENGGNFVAAAFGFAEYGHLV
jgi:hypothetical protein